MTEFIEVAVAVAYSPWKDRFLILKRAEGYDVFPRCWDFPSGRIENEDPRKTALRELKEETGLSGQVLRSGDCFEVETEYGNFLINPFLVKVDSDEVSLSEEHEEYRWINSAELEEMETVKALEKDFEAVGVSIEHD